MRKGGGVRRGERRGEKRVAGKSGRERSWIPGGWQGWRMRMRMRMGMRMGMGMGVRVWIGVERGRGERPSKKGQRGFGFRWRGTSRDQLRQLEWMLRI